VVSPCASDWTEAMPIVIQTKTRRLTNDQHRVEITALDVPVAALLGSSDETEADADRDEDAPAALPRDTIACDVYLSFESKDVDDSGYSRSPDEVQEDAPTEGAKRVVWRDFPLGETHGFLLRRTRKGAYTVEMNAEAHIRIVVGAATTTVTFPPTP